MKKSWKVLLTVIVILAAVGIVGCSSPKKPPTASEAPPEIQETAAERSIKKLTKDFLTKIMAGNLSDLADNILIPSDSFVTEEDLTWYIPRSQVSDFLDCKVKYEITKIESSDKEEEKNISKHVTIKVGDREYVLNVILNENNEWKFNFPDMFLQNWRFVVGDDVSVLINNIAVNDSYIEGAYTGNDAVNDHCVIYNIPYVVKKEVKLTLIKGSQKIYTAATPADYMAFIDYKFPEKTKHKG